MISLPDFSKAFEYENNFYLSCDPSRMARVIAHYELFKKAQYVEGDMVEAGVFKGTALARFAMFQKLVGEGNKKIIGFDTFGEFPETGFEGDKAPREKFIGDAGSQSISKEQLEEVMKHKGLEDMVELVEGDITKTVPEYVRQHPDLKLSLINLDVDIYEPSVTIMEELYPRLESGGVLILDDYDRFPGETKAIDDYLKGQNIEIHSFSYCVTPKYIVKP